jgi:hypothetical protein
MENYAQNLVSHQWHVAGEKDYATSITGGQYSYAFNRRGGWQINGSPTFSYNHEASGYNNWTFPLGKAMHIHSWLKRRLTG